MECHILGQLLGSTARAVSRDESELQRCPRPASPGDRAIGTHVSGICYKRRQSPVWNGDRQGMPASRRQFMLASAGMLALLPSTGLAAKPWVDKKPTEWSPADIDAVLNRSAWTRQVSPEFAADVLDSAGAKDGRHATAAEGLSDKRILPDFKVLVRWESGLPVRLARRNLSPAGYDDAHYMVSISRVPIAFMEALSTSGQAQRAGADSLDPYEKAGRIAQTSSLQRDGKASLQADHAYWSESDFESRIMISFSKGRQPIELTEREVTFVSRIGDLIIRAPFFLKEMVYRGKLEL